MGTHWPSPGEALYAASKAAVEQITRVASRELGHRGITANTLSLGPTDTGLLRAGVHPDEERDVVQPQPPVPRPHAPLPQPPHAGPPTGSRTPVREVGRHHLAQHPHRRPHGGRSREEAPNPLAWRPLNADRSRVELVVNRASR
ncbi:SDR family oxidoreductase [Streptomyces sp. NPDC056411]|uniref:SDR family oxidoreductase n=1 Tax=Streptomyces sp. NPDC056411 TaxID=3345813 RepID=UPI0035DE119B